MSESVIYDGGDGASNMYRLVQTPLGTYRAQYYAGNYGEWTKVRDPQSQEQAYHTPGLVDLQLAVRDGELLLEWTQWHDGSNRRPVMLTHTGIRVGTTGESAMDAVELQTVIDHLGHYDALTGETVRNQLNSMEAQVVGLRADNAYLANQNRVLTATLNAIAAALKVSPPPVAAPTVTP